MFGKPGGPQQEKRGDEDLDADELIAECLTTAILAGDYPEREWPAWFEASHMGTEQHGQVLVNDTQLKAQASSLLHSTWAALRTEFNREPSLHDTYMRAAFLLKEAHRETLKKTKETSPAQTAPQGGASSSAASAGAAGMPAAEATERSVLDAMAPTQHYPPEGQGKRKWVPN